MRVIKPGDRIGNAVVVAIKDGHPIMSDALPVQDTAPTDDNRAPHDPEFCQQPGCRECKRLREGQ